MNVRDIQAKIAVIIDNVEKIDDLKRRAATYNEFVSDYLLVDSTLRRLQTSIEALFDIGGFIISALGLKPATSNSDIIDILTEAGLIAEDRAAVYKEMSRFRNRIVHIYNHVDTEEVYRILMHDSGDINNFFTDLISIIEKNPD